MTIRAEAKRDALTALFVSMTDFIFRKALLLSVYNATVIQVSKPSQALHITGCRCKNSHNQIYEIAQKTPVTFGR
jgi:hypothetical protein